MQWIISFVVVLLLSGCAKPKIEINGLLCPEHVSEQQIQNDLRECRYYDQEAASKASKAFTPECQLCLERKGYMIQQ